MKPTSSLSLSPQSEPERHPIWQRPAASLVLAAFAFTVPVEPPVAVTDPEIKASLAWTNDPRIAAEAAERSRMVQRRAHLRSALITVFSDRSVEDGWTHPAQVILETHCAEYGNLAAADMSWIFRQMGLQHRVDLMKCLGRLDDRESLLLELASDSLKSQNIELRDATVCALERWGSAGALSALRLHIEPVPWLAEYVSQVLREADTAEPRAFC